jgi:hypothetical protein
MRDGTGAIIDNLRVVRPDATEPELKRLALLTYRSYARDTIDFIRSLVMNRTQFEAMMVSFDNSHLDEQLARGAASSSAADISATGRWAASPCDCCTGIR